MSRMLLRTLTNYQPHGVVPSRNDGGGSPFPPATSLGPHMVDYFRQPGDQVLVVADGDYDIAGFLNANQDQFVHPPTSGRYGGWLILLAQNYLGARIVGTTDQKMLFDGGQFARDYRVAVIGFDVDVFTHLHNAAYMRWVWTQHTNDIDRWYTTYTNRGGTMEGTDADRLVMNGITRWPSAFRIEPPVGDFHSHHLEFYCNDMHDIGDDAFYTARVYDSVWQGVKAWKVGHKGHDPGLANGNDFFHSDCLQVTGDFIRNTIRDSWLGYSTIAAFANGHMRDTRFLNLWLAGSPQWCFQLAKGYYNEITNCEITGVRAFCNGQTWDSNWNPHYFPPYDVPTDSITISADTRTLTNNVLYPQTLDATVPKFEIPITGVDRTVPADVRTTGGGAIVDINDLRDSIYNPANVFRATHTYANVLTWLTTIGWP